MSERAIIVENVSKSYLLGHLSKIEASYRYTALRDVIAREVRDFAHKAADLVRGRQIVQGDEVEVFWALKNVSFEVMQGDVVGIIGRNGAGKSTLLKILSRITEPTYGRVLLRGRVASLLEVGTGFHPELTGRENIFLNGSILGMSRREIRKKFDEIVAFAEVEKFLDTPVKRYSSGMYVRLAFAVAAHLEPDILIVDEVLAVGDAAFQKKCLGKMEEISHREGRTVLVVSHNTGLLVSLCPTAIWLQQGSIAQCGSIRAIIEAYLARGGPSHDRLVKFDRLSRTSVIDDRLRLESIEWLCELPLRHGERLGARVTFETRSPVSDVSVLLGFSSLEGGRILSYRSDYQDGVRINMKRSGLYAVNLEVDFLPLAPSIISLDIGCFSGDSHALDYISGAVQLEIAPGPTTPASLFQGFGGVRSAGKWIWDYD